MAKKEKWGSAVLGLGAVLLALSAGYLYTHPEETGRKRQQTEESLAQAYLEALLEEESVEPSQTEEVQEETLEAASALESETESVTLEETLPETSWADPNYYERDGITYTPEYAMGQLMGVLEVDHAGIRRGVYGGSWEAIQHDLDIWMVTEARPDYELGKTHMAIYGHNHTVQDLENLIL